MSAKRSPVLRIGFCINVETLCHGAVPIVSDGDGKPVVFETEFDAQREIVDYQITRLQQFLDGERDFDDAMTVEEYVVPVTVHPDGLVLDQHGNSFGTGTDR